ncbi:hypothetical protein BDZ45DRAFT_741776 [Acephala macrosclerotiorum]|nr:hypothetical protein BDZ45DRAFT_741776 [Acephala macrosclerotiorum]
MEAKSYMKKTQPMGDCWELRKRLGASAPIVPGPSSPVQNHDLSDRYRIGFATQLHLESLFKTTTKELEFKMAPETPKRARTSGIPATPTPRHRRLRSPPTPVRKGRINWSPTSKSLHQDENYGRLSPVRKSPSPVEQRRRARTPVQGQTIKKEEGNKNIKIEQDIDLIEFTPPRRKSDREEKPKSDYGVKEELKKQ